MPTDKIIQILLSLITTIAIALAGFALKWVFEANAELVALQRTIELKFADLDESILNLAEDNDDVTRLSSQITKHWRLHNWTKDQIAEIRHKLQMTPVTWPDLD